jgi:hypothetical protein
MRRAWISNVVVSVVGLAGLALLGCDSGPESGDEETGAGTDTDTAGSNPAFRQPTGLALVGRDETDAAIVHYAPGVDGDSGAVGQFVLGEPGPPAEALVTPIIDRITPSGAKPFSAMQITGANFTTDPQAAVSIVFEAPGLAPIAVPVLVATDSSLSFVAPVLIGDDGLDVRAVASVRVVQVLGSRRSVSEALDGVTIERIPPIEGERPATGMLTADFLGASANFMTTSIRGSARPLPADFVAATTQLASELTSISALITEAAQGSTGVTLPWSSGTAPALDTSTLDLMDRLVFAALRSPVAAMRAKAETVTRPRDAGGGSAPYGCPELDGTAEEQMASLLCMHHGHPAAMARVGEPAVAIGFQVVTSVYLGFWGGSATTLLALRSARAALAFEVVWAGLTGHLTAWMTGQKRPSAGQTLADAGTALADSQLRSAGALNMLWTMLSVGRSYDALLREAAATGGGGTDADTDTDSDSGTDTGTDSTPVGEARYEGTATLYSDPIQLDDDCVGSPQVDVVVTVTDFGGDGTPTDPYLGNVKVSGTLSVTGTACDGSLPLPEISGRIGGLQGAVGFDLEAAAPPRYEVHMSKGLVETPTRTLTGDLVVEFWPEGRFLFGVDGVIELSRVD